MKTITIRDCRDEVVAAIDQAAAAAGSRSRETYLRNLLATTLGPENSVTAAISSRARKAVEHFQTLGRFRVLNPAPTVALIARALGHANTSTLESQLRGDRALDFADGDRLCALLGLDRSWLESGGSDVEPRFALRPHYFDATVLLHDILMKNVSYDEFYFVLTDGDDSVAAVVGHNRSDDPAVDWKYVLLLDDVPVHDNVGGTGRAQRREFGDLLATLYNEDVFVEPPMLLGRIAPYAQYDGVMAGFVHISTLTNTNAPPGHSSMSVPSNWASDFWMFEERERYTKGYDAGHKALLADLRTDGITSTDAYRARIAKTIRSGKLQKAHRP